RWTEVVDMPLEALSRELLQIAASIKLKRYSKSVRGPKKPPPKKKGNKRTNHLSTKRILDKRKEK
ncbi:MAG: transposase, partial [Planctomycetota bacterium]